MGRFGSGFAMLKEAAVDWNDDNAPRLGAALSYYTVFSLAPLLLITISIAGLVFGQDAAQGRIVSQIDGLLGKEGALAVEAILENARKPAAGILATLAGVVTLLFGATGVFNELRSSLNTVWEVETPSSGGLFGMVRARFVSFTMVLGIGFLLLVSLALSAGLAAVDVSLNALFPSAAVVLPALNLIVSLGVVTLLFALIYKVLPDVAIEWRDVWFGAAVTAALFTLGKLAIGLYLGRGSVGSAYGAAGSLVVILVWVYYAAQILFFGAELTQVYARKHGSRLGTPKKSARPAAGNAASGDRLRGAPLPLPVAALPVAALPSAALAAAALPSVTRKRRLFREPASLAVGLTFSLGLLLLGRLAKGDEI